MEMVAILEFMALTYLCTHFGEIPSKDNIAEMEGRAVQWMSAVADTIIMMMTYLRPLIEMK